MSSFPSNINQTFAAINIPYLSDIFVGSHLASTQKYWLIEHNINYILTIDGSNPPSIHINDPYHYHYNITVTPDNFEIMMPRCLTIINNAFNTKNNILICCETGTNISVAIVVAYIMHYYNYNYIEAINLINDIYPTEISLQMRTALMLYNISLQIPITPL